MCFIAVFSLLLLVKHYGINFMPRERLHIGSFIRIKLLLETDLEAGLQEISLHFCGRL